jgi:CRISPR-associated protein Cmr1
MGRPARWYFPADTQFQVTLSTRDQDKSMLKEATAAFWLLTQLGGIGSRSRRCAGSLVTTSVTGNTTNLLSAPSVNLFSPPSTIQGLRDQLQNGIRASRDLYKKLPQRSTPNVQFDILAKGACRIWILQGPGPQLWRSAEDTLSAIGESLQSYRSSISPPERRTIFGLPLLIRGLQNWKLRKQLEESRRASPLHLHVTKLQTTEGTRFVGVVVLFKTQGAGIRTPDYKLIEDWIARDFPIPSALEVML